MTANERLRELLKEFDSHPEKTCPQFNTGKSCEGCKYFKKQHCDIDGRRVDFLLENGVIIPPCNVGGVVYSVCDCINRPEKLFITALHQYEKYISFSALSRSQRKYVFETTDIGKTVFLTKEEAEKAVKGGAE